MEEKRITLPLTAELAKTLHAGDRVLLDRYDLYIT